MKRRSFITALLGFALTVAACGGDVASGSGETTTMAPTTSTAAEPETTTTTTTAATTSLSTTTTTTAPPSGETTPPPSYSPGDDAVAFAIADLAAFLGIPEGDIELVERAEVVWSDGSLGCPQPGMSYTQALVDGSRIVLEAGGAEYEYHSGAGRAPFLCLNPS